MATTEHEDPRIARTRQAVLETVAELLAEGGWEHVTHQRIAERSGYARSTIYRHWPERIDFLRDLSDHAEQRSHSPEPSGDLRDDLLADLRAYRDVLFDLRGGTTLSALIGIAEHSPEADAIRAASVERGETPVRELLAAATGEGRLAPDLDPATAASELFGPITHRRLMTRTRPDDDELAQLIDNFLARHSTPKHRNA